MSIKNIFSGFKTKPQSSPRFNPTLSEAYNLVYGSVVNGTKYDESMQKKVEIAKTRIEENTFGYEDLEYGVLGFLSFYMAAFPSGKITFFPSNEGVLGVRCHFKDVERFVVFNDKGTIIKDEERKLDSAEKSPNL